MVIPTFPHVKMPQITKCWGKKSDLERLSQALKHQGSLFRAFTRLTYQPMRISFPEIEAQHMAKEVLLTIKHVFAGIAVADYDSALAWYKRFFGRPPDVIVTEHESMWQVAEAGWIYIVGDTTRAGSVLLTLLVDNLEDHIAELGERGLETSAIETVPGLYRKAVITDPEGNIISLGEDLSTDA